MPTSELEEYLLNIFNKFYTSFLYSNNRKNNIPSIAVAYSGGIDSLALAIILDKWKAKNLRQKLSLQIKNNFYALIIDHYLRTESTSDANHAKILLEQYSNNNYITKIIPWIEGKETYSNIEAKAREARYSLLINYCKKHKIENLIFAHHADDQLETFLMRLTRGSGLDGLTCMKKCFLKENIKICRPFLEIPKSLLKEFLEENQYQWIEDTSNKDTKFQRNKLRSMLEQMEDKDLLRKRIMQTTEHFNRIYDYLDKEVQYHYENCTKFNQDLKLYDLNLQYFRNLHQEIGLRLLILILSKLSGKKYKPRWYKLKSLYDEIINCTENKKKTLSNCKISIKLKSNNIIIEQENSKL